MTELPIELNEELIFHSAGGFGRRDIPVKVIGFKKTMIETIGLEDKRYRLVPRTRVSRK